MRRIYGSVFCYIFVQIPLFAQPFSRHLQHCLKNVSFPEKSIQINLSEADLWIRPNLLSALPAFTLYPDSTAFPKLSLSIIEATGAPNNSFSLTAKYTLTAADGALLAEQICSESHVVPISDAEKAELKRQFPAIQWKENPSKWKKIVQPALLSLAVGISTWLFFNVRK